MVNHVKKHSHPTMDEYFFVYKGSGIYEIGDDILSIQKGDFIKIPANTPHELSVEDSNENLELIYFGIDLEK
jgi:mannose-6-phosphate isomerase-like protein (cupin superfamily)